MPERQVEDPEQVLKRVLDLAKDRSHSALSWIGKDAAADYTICHDYVSSRNIVRLIVASIYSGLVSIKLVLSYRRVSSFVDGCPLELK